MSDQATASADIAAVHALIARLAANDIDGDDRAALLALRDAVIARAPLEDMRPLTNVEKLQRGARARFDATFKRPTEGPVADALDRAAARKLTVEERQALAYKLGRYYAEAYRVGAGPILWRVQDRYMGQIAYFALDNPKRPARLEGYRTKEEALTRIHWFDRYFHERGIKIGPRACTLPETELVADGVYQEPAPEPKAAPAKPRTPRIPKEPVWQTPRKVKNSHFVTREVPSELWHLLHWLIPSEPVGTQKTKPRTVNDRTVMAGVLHYLRNDIGWFSLPSELGCSPMLVRKRLKEWMQTGVWAVVEDVLYDRLKDRDTIQWDKAYGEPFASKNGKRSTLESAERFRKKYGLTPGELSMEIFGHGSTYPRALERSNILESTRVTISKWIAEAKVEWSEEVRAGQWYGSNDPCSFAA